jgi:8-oxo-dGTP pyrophosphatase MutT (NUDIX family)
MLSTDVVTDGMPKQCPGASLLRRRWALEYGIAILSTAMHTSTHPKQDERGRQVLIAAPTTPTPVANWLDPALVATVIPGGPLPPELNGIAFSPWRTAPQDDIAWSAVAGQEDADIDEPDFVPAPGKRVAAGVVVIEDDGRVWVVHPSNAFGGYPATFPKGTKDPGVPLRATAIREAWEESGLRVVLTGFLADLTRSRSRTRYYLGRRVGGCPSDMGWESQAVSLVPRALLHTVLVNPNDAPLVALLQA